jgi:anti-sigma B factor antagonist
VSRAFAAETTELGDGTRVVKVSGDLELYTVSELKSELAQQGPRARIVVELSGVTFLDSTALGAIVQAARKLRDEGGDLTLVCSDSNILKVLTITGLIRIFTVHATLDEAVAEGMR